MTMAIYQVVVKYHIARNSPHQVSSRRHCRRHVGGYVCHVEQNIWHGKCHIGQYMTSPNATGSLTKRSSGLRAWHLVHALISSGAVDRGSHVRAGFWRLGGG